MKAVVKYYNIKKIVDNGDGTVTIHYSHSLSYVQAINKVNGQEKVKLGDVHQLTVSREDLVDIYV